MPSRAKLFEHFGINVRFVIPAHALFRSVSQACSGLANFPFAPVVTELGELGDVFLQANSAYLCRFTFKLTCGLLRLYRRAKCVPFGFIRVSVLEGHTMYFVKRE